MGEVISISDGIRGPAVTENPVIKPTKEHLRNIGKARAEDMRQNLITGTTSLMVFVNQLAEVKYEKDEWQAIGYGNFIEYIHGEFNDQLVKMPKHLRKAIAESPVVKQAGFTQAELAAITGTSKSTITKDKANQDGRKSSKSTTFPPTEIGNDGLISGQWLGDDPPVMEDEDPDPEVEQDGPTCTPESCGPDNSVEEAIKQIERLSRNLRKSRIITDDQHRKLVKIHEREAKWHATFGQ